MSRAWVPEAKKVQDTTIRRQGDGHSILGCNGVIMLDFLPKRSIITGVFYTNLLDQLRAAIREKRRGNSVLLQQENATINTCKVEMDAVERNGYELIPHPAYSPDLAPISKPEKGYHGCHFRSNEEVVTAIEELVNGKDPDFFSSELMRLEHRWSKYIILESNYIEKEEVNLNRK